MGCLTDEEIVQWVDGGVAENESGRLRSHLDACGVCLARVASLRTLIAGIGAPVALDEEAHVKQIIEALPPLSAEEANARSASTPSESSFMRKLRARQNLFTAVALAAGIALFVRSNVSTERVEEFQARGDANGVLSHDVGVTVRTVEGKGPVLDGAIVSKTAKFFASYRNIGKAAAYAMVFVQDTKGELHWLYPEFVDPKTDPESIVLPKAERETPLSEGAQFEDLAVGEGTLLTVRSRSKLRVSEVEALAKDGQRCSKEKLEKTFAGVSATALRLQVSP